MAFASKVAQKAAYDDYLRKSQADMSDPKEMSYGESKTSDPEMICNYFADFFRSVYASDDVSSVSDSQQIDVEDENVVELRTDMGTLSDSLKSIDTSKDSGPDYIAPMFLMKCSTNLAVPFHLIFNLSLSSKTFPSHWKTSYVKPIYKAGSRSTVVNYRGVAILPTFGKLFESIVC